MNTRARNHPGPFESEAWTHSIVLREPHRIVFGFGWQRNGGWLCLLLAIGLVLGGIGVLVEPAGLGSRDDEVARWVIGAGVFAAALVLALIGFRLLRGTNRVGVLDLQLGCFSAVDSRSGEVGETIPCGQLQIHLDEAQTVDTNEVFHGKIAIVGPDRPDREGAAPRMDVTLLRCLDQEIFFAAVRDLEEAASWGGITGDERLIQLYRERP